MNAKKALKVLAQPLHPSTRVARYQAANTLAAEVKRESQYGDPDESLTDWIYNGDYDGSETVASIVAEWDGDR